MANTGFLPTYVSNKGKEISAVLPVTIEISKDKTCVESNIVRSLDDHSPLKISVGQLDGRLSTRIMWYELLTLLQHIIALYALP